MAPQQSQQPDGPHGSGGEAGGGGGTDACAQEPSAEGGIRAAERSAERAAALAATEGFHQLRLRPYVGAPSHEESGTTTVRPLLDASGDGPDTADLGLFPETFAEFAADGAGPYGGGGHEGDGTFAGYAEYAEYAAYEDGEFGPYAGAAYGGYGNRPDAARAEAADHGRHRRRRRGIVVAAAAVAASALAAGAVAVTGQVMGDEQGATGHALPDLSASVPDVTLPADASPATAGTAKPVTSRPRTVPTPPTPPAESSPSPKQTAPTAPTPPSPTATATTAPPKGADTPSPAAVAGPQVLQLGDSGPAVADLQRRLTEVWVYHGPIDGVFDRQVQKAVETFQVWYWVSDSPDGAHNGVYGPRTRAVLERQTGAGD